MPLSALDHWRTGGPPPIRDRDADGCAYLRLAPSRHYVETSLGLTFYAREFLPVMLRLRTQRPKRGEPDVTFGDPIPIGEHAVYLVSHTLVRIGSNYIKWAEIDTILRQARGVQRN